MTTQRFRNPAAATAARRRGGFTLIETLSSCAILTMLVFAAFGATEVAMRASSRVASIEAADTRSADALSRIRRLLMPASLSMLEAIPPIANAAPEPMQDTFVYDNIRFRMVAGFASGARVFVPPVAANPWRIWLQTPQTGSGSLMFDDGKTVTSILEDVRGATFVLTGRHLTITLQTDRPDKRGVSTCQLKLAILVQ
jgi:hypothetical protein